MKDMMRSTIRTLRLGNLALATGQDIKTRIYVAKLQSDLLDRLELLVNECEITKKEKK